VYVGKVRRTHAFSYCLSSFGGIDPSSIATFWVCVSFTKMEVGRDVTGSLGSKSKKWELVVRDT